MGALYAVPAEPEDEALILTEAALQSMAALKVALLGLEQIALRGGSDSESAMSTMRRVKAVMCE